jgi:hypothetical protein
MRTASAGRSKAKCFPIALTIAALVGVGAVGCTGSDDPSQPGSQPPASAATVGTGDAAPDPADGSATAPARPSTLVAVTTGGALVLLNPANGQITSTLRDSGVVGDSLAVSPDGTSVFYEVGDGCQHQVWRVGTDGSGAELVAADGSKPALSPDGTELAYATQYFDCFPDGTLTAGYHVVVTDLGNGAERRFPMPPEAAASGLPAPITHLSWSPDATSIAVSISASESNEGWRLAVMDPRADSYYLQDDGSTETPLPGVDPATFYYEGVYLPNDNLFVVRQCCSGYPLETNTVELLEISPASGETVHQIATGFTDRTHTSLDADATGRWLLYLSGEDVQVSLDGARPTTLASGFQAAAW